MPKLDLNNLTWKQALLLLPLIIGGFIAAVVLLEAFNADGGNAPSHAAPPASTPQQTALPSESPFDTAKCWVSGECIKQNDESISKALQQLQEFANEQEFAPELQPYISYVLREHAYANSQCSAAPDLVNPGCFYLIQIAVDAQQTAFVLDSNKKQPQDVRRSTTEWLIRASKDADAQRALLSSDQEMGNVTPTFPLRVQLISEVDDWIRRADALLGVHSDLNAWLAVKNAELRLTKLHVLTRK